MSIKKINNVFSDSELEVLNNIVNNCVYEKISNNKNITNQEDSGVSIHIELGRLQFGNLQLTKEIADKITAIASDILGFNAELDHSLYSEYSSEYGFPNLPPHLDADNNDLVIDYQLDANTEWGLAAGLDIYSLENNSALAMNANQHIHWRPHKTFEDKEYVKMIFFRFYNPKNRSDYSVLKNYNSGEIFENIRKYRDTIIKK